MAKDESKKMTRTRTVFLWAGSIIAVVALLFLALAGAAFAYERSYAEKIFPGVRVFGIRLDGMTKAEAQQALEHVVDETLAKGLPFVYQGKTFSVSATSIGTSPDDSHDYIKYDIGDVVDRAYALGHDGGWQARMAVQSRLRVSPVDLQPNMMNDLPGIGMEVDAALSRELHGPSNASYVINTSSTPPSVQVTSGQSGIVLQMDAALAQLQTRAASLDFQPITILSQEEKPSVTQDDLNMLLPFVQDYLTRPSLTFTYQDSKYPISTGMLASWISVTGTEGNLGVTLDPVAFSKSIHELAGSIEQEGKTGSLETKDGKIVSFVAGTPGIAIDVDAMRQDVLDHWPASSTFPVITKVKPALLVGSDPEQMGITELLGVGHSNFAGSPVNRRKNIAHGIALVNGTVIQPGDTFSLIKTLGAIDGEHDWLPELVIKDNKTTPEFGGGLCQIGTTTFRAALASGLPIVERANHSYRVSYYEPAGTDATIYDPKPDFRFLNDTAHPILIHAYETGNDVYFEFWGTRDGRQVVQTKPVVTNIVQPPPMKLIETLDLAPGQKKCTESAHAGADASFDYTVTYASGDVKAETFRSHYKPWQAVCMIGVKTLSATSTPSGVQ